MKNRDVNPYPNQNPNPNQNPEPNQTPEPAEAPTYDPNEDPKLNPQSKLG